MRKRYWFDKKTQSFVELRKRPYRAVAPAIRCDTIDEYCHATGKHYTSRSEKMLDLKMNGIEELGHNEVIKPRAQKEEDYERDIIDTIQEVTNDLRWGNAPEVNEPIEEQWDFIDD